MLIHDKYVCRTILRTVAAITLACAATQPRSVLAQATATTATLTGVVVDEADGTVPDVRVTLVNLDNGLQRTVATNGEGVFAVPLPAGRYTVTAQRDGFAPAEVPDVLLTVNEPVALRILLKVGSITDSVVVTAQKRGEERLQDVPVPVTAISTERLAANNQVLLRDYYMTIPGLSLAPNSYGAQRLSIRGITTGGSGATVGVMIDDVPYGSAVGFAAAGIPNIDPGEVVRLEVLRGPQGTLYGASSMGGLMKYVTVDPRSVARALA